MFKMAKQGTTVISADVLAKDLDISKTYAADTQARVSTIKGAVTTDGANNAPKVVLGEVYYPEDIKIALKNASLEKLVDTIIHVEFWIHNDQVVDSYCRNLFVEKGGDIKELEAKKKAVIGDYDSWLGSCDA